MFEISLAEWSLHRALQAGRLDHMDFPRVARQDCGIEAIELVNTFFKDQARDRKYLSEFKQRADDLGVKILLVMCDHEGELGGADVSRRRQAVENHRQWLEVARFFGCHSIRVNAHSSGSETEQRERVADGLRQLSGHAAELQLNVLVENHGGFSSDGKWVASLIKAVNLPNCGTLPDFGNFKLADGTEYDRYQGVTEMMPFAKAVSAKAHDFDPAGNETRIDYRRMLSIVLDANYHGYLGVEYSGERLTEIEGIQTTKRLLEKARTEFETRGAA